MAVTSLLLVVLVGCRGGAPAADLPAGDTDPASTDTACESPRTAWRDADGDGFGAGEGTTVCGATEGFAEVGGDCDDLDETTFPGAPEVCGDRRFEDCDRATVCRYGMDATVTDAALVIDGRAEMIAEGYGDFDDDGLADVVLGSSAEDDQGGVYVFRGGRDTGAASATDADATVRPGFYEALWIGDVTGEGVDDLFLHTGSSADRSLVLSWPFDADVAPADQAVALLPALLNSGRGWSGPGDVDGDGVNDILVGDPYYNELGDTTDGPDDGAAWVFAGPVEGDLDFGDAAAVIRGHDEQRFGYYTHRVGDLDGDGLDDIGVTSYVGPGGQEGGELFLFFGARSGTLSSDDADARLYGVEPDAVLASQDVAGGHDVDGDGYSDLLVGARGWSTSSIGAWLVPGPVAAGQSPLDEIARSTFTTIDGNDGYLGVATVLPGDMDGDGQDEVVLGWREACRPDGSSCPGVTSIFYGPAGDGTRDWRDADGLVWGTGNAAEEAGHLHGIGDFDGDGLADLALGGGGPYGPAQAYILLGAAP